MPLDSQEARFPDGLLQPDELWRADCNLGSSILDLSNMDPHLILVIFLPPLLFESAFGRAALGL